MADHYMEILSTPAVLAARQAYYGEDGYAPHGTEPEDLTPEHIRFIEARDSFYLASVSENGWPYVQHRGGPPGFLQVTGPRTLAFADLHGNSQLLTVGNLAICNRVSLFLMDYPHRARLKILGEARVLDAREHPDLADRLAQGPERRRVERIFLIDVVSYDGNCPQQIHPRYTREELEPFFTPFKEKIKQLEADLAVARGLPPVA